MEGGGAKRGERRGARHSPAQLISGCRRRRWGMRRRRRGTIASSSCLPSLLFLWDCHTVPPPSASDVHQLPSASIRGLFSCLCCIAFARQFPLLSMGHCSFLLPNLPPLNLLSLSFSFSPSLYSQSKFSFLPLPLIYLFFFLSFLPSSSPQHGIN